MNYRTHAQWQRLADWPHLLDSLPSLINELGFRFYAFTFVSPTQRENITNYPARWLEYYDLRGYAALDPVPVHCQTSSLPLPWLASTFDKTPEIWTEAQACGLCHGWVQPIHDEHTRSSLSVVRPHVSVSTQELYEKAAQVMWLGELLHRASTHFFARPNHDHRPGAPVYVA